jgi:hypothetical protein
MWELRNIYKSLVRNSDGRRPHGRPRHRWEDNIKMAHKETECEGVDWILLAQWALVNMVMNLHIA